MKRKTVFNGGKLPTKARMIILGVLVLAVVLFPAYVTDAYIIRIATLCVMYSALAMTLNLVTGVMGQVSLGHAAFLGIGAYTSALLSTHFGLTFEITALCALVFSALFGVLLGVPALKLSGSYLAIVTLGFCEVIRLVELNWVSLTRGPMGITGIDKPKVFGIQIKSNAGYYLLCLVLLAIIMVIVMNIMSSRLGRAIKAIREDEIAASAMGVDIRYYKVLTFTISAALAGMMGAFYAHYMRFIDPNAFNFDQSTMILSMVILGGLGSVPGSIFGAIILSLLPEVLRSLTDYRMLIYGLAIAIMMIFRPQGILGRKTFADLLAVRKKYAVSNEEAAALEPEAGSATDVEEVEG